MLSKFFPFPWRLRKTALVDALRRSVDRLRLAALDIYLIHFPWGPVSIETWVEALADAAEAGLVRAVGVSNYNASQVRRAHAVLSSRGIVLACNEVELSLAHRAAEGNGTLAACRELGVTLVAYRPLALGRLTGGESVQTHGWRRLMAAGRQARPSLAETVRQIGLVHGGKTPSQVALNWVLCKGALPIPGATSIPHLQENAGALGWRLTDSEVAALQAATIRVHAHPPTTSGASRVDDQYFAAVGPRKNPVPIHQSQLSALCTHVKRRDGFAGDRVKHQELLLSVSDVQPSIGHERRRGHAWNGVEKLLSVGR